MNHLARLGNSLVAILLLAAILSGCEVKLKAPDKPITINLNVNVEHSVDVKVDKELEKIITKNPEVF